MPSPTQQSDKLPYGTLRREPGQGFAHAILLDQGHLSRRWLVVDLYGACGDILTNAEVEHWPVVYVPDSNNVDSKTEKVDISMAIIKTFSELSNGNITKEDAFDYLINFIGVKL